MHKQVPTQNTHEKEGGETANLLYASSLAKQWRNWQKETGLRHHHLQQNAQDNDERLKSSSKKISNSNSIVLIHHINNIAASWTCGECSFQAYNTTEIVMFFMAMPHHVRSNLRKIRAFCCSSWVYLLRHSTCTSALGCRLNRRLRDERSNRCSSWAILLRHSSCTSALGCRLNRRLLDDAATLIV